MKELLMQIRFTRVALFSLTFLMIASLFLVDAGAQTRKKRRARRASKPAVAKPVITNPQIAPASGDQANDVKVVSTADETSTGSDQSENAAETKGRKKADQPEDMQQTITTLSNQVDRLNDKLSQMQENDRAILDMERLTRAEQRAESLRSQQVEAESKLADLQSRLEQIEYNLKPENIERATATYGTVHPEEARESRRKQLENEKVRVQAQIKILENSRVRLEQAITSADNEVDLLRRRLEAQQQQQDNAQTPKTERPANRRKPE
jgi:chromosome segregation ATPase